MHEESIFKTVNQLAWLDSHLPCLVLDTTKDKGSTRVETWDAPDND